MTASAKQELNGLTPRDLPLATYAHAVRSPQNPDEDTNISFSRILLRKFRYQGLFWVPCPIDHLTSLFYQRLSM